MAARRGCPKPESTKNWPKLKAWADQLAQANTDATAQVLAGRRAKGLASFMRSKFSVCKGMA
jgi:hypothetical protein